MRGLGSIPTEGNILKISLNPNLRNIARSDSIGFKTKNPFESDALMRCKEMGNQLN